METFDQRRDREERERVERMRDKQKLAGEMIDASFKELAKTMHPDAGGSVEGFQRLVLARDYMRRMTGPIGGVR